ncbi:MAG TPA: type II toxin-antitoxin system VapC family toxin [Caulobacteraceae bacterium]|nr:type II toxin-antitoxin system VapC family toxin [Caulobacteraceae bacterium]
MAAAVMVDSNVLLDVMSEDPAWGGWSAAALERAGDEGSLLINAVVYAEVSIRYSRIEELEAALPRLLIGREPIPFEAAFLAGKAFTSYQRRGGLRRSPPPDFLIGAHAAVAGYRLLTRDVRRYRTYFPRLELIAPQV